MGIFDKLLGRGGATQEQVEQAARSAQRSAETLAAIQADDKPSSFTRPRS